MKVFLVLRLLACLFIDSSEYIINGKKPRLIVRLFEHPWAIALEKFSYSLYLIHGPVLVLVRYFLFRLQLSPAMFAVISYVAGVTISLLVAYLFYLVFERPFMSSFLKGRKVKDAVI